MILYKDFLNLLFRNLIVCMSLCVVNVGFNKVVISVIGLNMKRFDDEMDVFVC